MENNLNVVDILDAAYNDSASNVEDAFNSVIQQKMMDAIQMRRHEIAAERMDVENLNTLETENEDEDI